MPVKEVIQVELKVIKDYVDKHSHDIIRKDTELHCVPSFRAAELIEAGVAVEAKAKKKPAGKDPATTEEEPENKD